MKNKEIEQYITKSADFARPILTHLRDLVHKACPDAEEKLKWGFPHFDYEKRNLAAAIFFDKFPYSHRKESIQWIEEAKTPETRNKRILTTIEWTTEGKPRNWKYK